MKRLVLLATLILTAVGCAPSKRVDPFVLKVQDENLKLRADQAQLQKKIEDMNNTMMVLQDRIETLKIALEKAPVRSTRKTTVVKQNAPEEVREEGETFLRRIDPKEATLPTLKLSNRDLDGNVGEPEKVQEKKLDNEEASAFYNEAFQSFESKSYLKSIGQFEEFVQKFHEHSYADNAVFWIGEAYFQMGDYAKSSEQFERVVKEFPTGNKVPDALLRAGDCYLRLSRPADAKKSFERVVELYPQSVAAKKARAWIADFSTNQSKGRT